MSWSKASKGGLLSSVNAVFVFKGGRHPVLQHEKEGNFDFIPFFFFFELFLGCHRQISLNVCLGTYYVLPNPHFLHIVPLDVEKAKKDEKDTIILKKIPILLPSLSN